MPVLSGLDAADRIKKVSPRSKIVFVTQEDDAEIRHGALAAGASGYVLKTDVHGELLKQSLRCATSIPPFNGLRDLLHGVRVFPSSTASLAAPQVDRMESPTNVQCVIGC